MAGKKGGFINIWMVSISKHETTEFLGTKVGKFCETQSATLGLDELLLSPALPSTELSIGDRTNNFSKKSFNVGKKSLNVGNYIY